MWIIVGNNGASGDDGVFALTSLVVRGLAVQQGGCGVGGGSLFSELSFAVVQFVSMS
jgi:hypothetical protein